MNYSRRLPLFIARGQNFMDGLVQTEADSLAHGSIITGQARQLTDLVKQILLFASTENGTNRYTLRPLQVLGILEGVRKNVAVLVEGNGFDVEQHVEAGLPHVMGDLSALSHCLQNLILNAVKYSGKNRWIGISASVHEAENRHKEVRISVQDHGSGISSSELPHIFEPFYRSPKRCGCPDSRNWFRTNRGQAHCTSNGRKTVCNERSGRGEYFYAALTGPRSGRMPKWPR